ncbi:phage major capsid protein [Bauldia litoralis]|uniref:phage major capsid protein n=1 Tax=Bauldia litoralis TaxID=665467 RepID=UPI003263DA46
MLQSVTISRRQSEIRQALAGLVGKDTPTEDETRSMTNLESEYATNETRYRAALIAEDSERREAGDELETRSDREYADLIGKFELRQVALMLDEGRALDGATAEVVSELREQGGYRGVPVPWMALEKRAGETVASGTPDPVRTMPILDRIFADSAAVRMGASMVNVGQGEMEYPVTTSAVSAGWADGETASVAGPTVFATTDRPLAPDNTYGITMKLTRKSLKQSGAALEAAVRRDMNGAIAVGLDAAVFRGTGANGQPTGILAGASGWGITDTDITALASWSAFRAAVTRFIVANAANGPGAVRMLTRPEVWSYLDDALIEGTAVSEWDRLVKNVPNIVLSSNALAAPAGATEAVSAILTTTVNGVSPLFLASWGAIDLIRDPYSDAASGGLRLTALTTMDVTISRAAQIEILNDIELAVDPEA